MAAQDGTTQYHRYCTAFVLAQGKPLTLAVEPVDGEESKADAGEHPLARVEIYLFEIERIVMDRATYIGEVIGVPGDCATSLPSQDPEGVASGETLSDGVVHDRSDDL